MNETTIRAEHNRPDNELDVVIRIYNLNGAAIKLIRTKVQSSGFVIPPVEWDGKDDGGSRVGRGLYPYNVTITTPDGEMAVASGRMIIL